MVLNKFLGKKDPNYTCRNINDVTQWFVKTNLCFTVEKHVKELVVHGEREFSFSTFATRFKFPKLFLLFLLTVKRFLAALLSDMKCLLQHYSDINFSWVIKAWHFLFLPWKVAGKCLKCWLLFWTLGTAIVVICSNYHDSITREILLCM